MEVSTDYRDDNRTLVIDVGEKFDFSKVEDFRLAYQHLGDEVNHIAIDLGKTEYMDSSALGMLLNMQKNLVDRMMSFSIENSRPQVERILRISRFDKKFTIS